MDLSWSENSSQDVPFFFSFFFFWNVGISLGGRSGNARKRQWSCCFSRYRDQWNGRTGRWWVSRYRKASFIQVTRISGFLPISRLFDCDELLQPGNPFSLFVYIYIYISATNLLNRSRIIIITKREWETFVQSISFYCERATLSEILKIHETRWINRVNYYSSPKRNSSVPCSCQPGPRYRKRRPPLWSRVGRTARSRCPGIPCTAAACGGNYNNARNAVETHRAPRKSEPLLLLLLPRLGGRRARNSNRGGRWWPAPPWSTAVPSSWAVAKSRTAGESGRPGWT